MSELEVPKNWNIVKIEDVVDKNHPYPIGDGDHGQIKPSVYQSQGVPYIRVTDIVNNQIVLDRITYIPKNIHNVNKKSHLFPGDIVIAKTGATIGKVAIIPDWMKEANTTSSVGKISIDSTKMIPKFLYYFIQTNNFKNQMWAVSKKSAQPGFNIINLKNFLIPKPSIITQKKIVQKLDHILVQLEEKKKKIFALNNIVRVLNISKSFEKKILISAFSGLLSQRNTQDEPVDKLLLRIKQKNKLENTLLSMFPNPSHIIPKEWKWVKIDQLCHGIVPGRYKPTEFDGPFPWITMPDITEFYIKKSKKDLGVTEDEAKKVRMKIFPKNTILMSCVGEVGRICIAETALVPNQQFHGFYPYDKILPEYIAYALLSENKQIMNSATETTISYLNKTKCNSLFIPLAPLEEQKRIVNIISRKFKVLDLIDMHFSQIESKYLIIKNHFDILNSQVLSYAFSGKLVN